jgi:hypothetical protein
VLGDIFTQACGAKSAPPTWAGGASVPAGRYEPKAIIYFYGYLDKYLLWLDLTKFLLGE